MKAREAVEGYRKDDVRRREESRQLHQGTEEYNSLECFNHGQRAQTPGLKSAADDGSHQTQLERDIAHSSGSSPQPLVIASSSFYFI